MYNVAHKIVDPKYIDGNAVVEGLARILELPFEDVDNGIAAAGYPDIYLQGHDTDYDVTYCQSRYGLHVEVFLWEEGLEVSDARKIAAETYYRSVEAMKLPIRFFKNRK